jgi:ABC-2 type transport system ATP-binding protein
MKRQPMTGEVVVFNQVTKRYGNQFALNDVTYSLPGNRIIGVLGPNGSGKSTMFRLITGLTHVDRGDIKVLGKKPGWQTNRKIAYLPDRARWYAHHTVRRAFDYAEDFLPGFDKSAALRLAGLMKVKLDMRAGGMSRGQEARLMLILCIARNVPLIILDEPFSGIDTISREQIIEGLINYMSDASYGGDENGQQGGRTILISTHEIYEAESLFDHAMFLNEGQIVLSGEADVLRSGYGSMRSIMKKLYV